VFAKWEATQERLKLQTRHTINQPDPSNEAESPQKTNTGSAFLDVAKEPLGLHMVMALAAILVGMSLFGKFGLAMAEVAGIVQLGTLWRALVAKSADERRVRLRNGAIIFMTALILITWNDYNGAKGFLFSWTFAAFIAYLGSFLHRRARPGVVIAFQVLIVVVIIGILAAIAIPAYLDREYYSRVYDAMNRVEPLRAQVEEHIRKTGRLPDLASEVPGITPVKVKNWAVAQVENNGVIVVRFEPSQGGPLAGATVEFTPVLENNDLSWRCDGGTLRPRYRSKTCWVYHRDNLDEVYTKYRIPSKYELAQNNQVRQAMNRVKSLHQKVQDHILKAGYIPASASEIPEAAPVKMQNTASARLENNGTIVIRFEQSLGQPLAGAVVALFPVIENNTLSWQCEQGALPPAYRSSTCWSY
jgi:Tfp pilus assembly major pilin PilA